MGAVIGSRLVISGLVLVSVQLHLDSDLGSNSVRLVEYLGGVFLVSKGVVTLATPK